MEDSAGQYPLVNVNKQIIRGSGSDGHGPDGIYARSEGVDFDPRNLIPVPIVFCDEEGQIVWLNTAAEELTGFSSHQLVGKTYIDLFPDGRRSGIARRVLRSRRNGEAEFYLEAPIQTATLKPHWIGVRVKRVPAPADKNVYVCSLHDLQAMRDELESLRRQVSELEARIDEATASVQLKSEFVRAISEDIRAPMNGVVGMSRFLLETELSPEQQTFAEVIENSGQQLLDVVDDLLDFTRIEAGELEIQSIDFDLRVAVEAVAVTLGTRATDRHLGFTFGVDPAAQSELIGDPGRFRQVLLNLGETVIEESEGGSICLQVELAEESARGLTLRVTIETSVARNRGSSEQSVFEAFSTGEASNLRLLGSRGLGLNLCRQVISLMRGEVIPTDGESTSLVFCVPFQKQAIPEAIEEHTDSIPEDIGLEGVHVVVADALVENGAWLAETLAGWGCKATQARSREEIVDSLRRELDSGATRQAVMVDLDFPGAEMEDIVSAIRGDTMLAATPLMMMTSMGRPGDAERASRLGFRAYLTKPIEPVDLKDAVADVVGAHHKADGTTPLVTRHLLAERRRNEVPAAITEQTEGESPVTPAVTTGEEPPAEPMIEAAQESPAESVTAAEPTAPSVQPTPEPSPEGLRDALKNRSEALLDLTQVLGLQATLAKGRLRKAIQIGNRREIEWEARSLEKMYGATGSDELCRRFGELARIATAGELAELQSKWDDVERYFEEGDPPFGITRKAA